MAQAARLAAAGVAPFLIVPVPGYIGSSGCGPLPFRELEWIEIDPVRVSEHWWRLPRAVDNLARELLSRLAALGVQAQRDEGAKVRVTASGPAVRPAP